MDRRNQFHIDNMLSIKKILRDSKFLGKGHSGRVYLMPDGRAIKIFKNAESCMRECMILESIRGNRHFPKVYECRGHYMIRQYVSGICLTDYLKSHKLSKRLALSLIRLIQDFKMLGFIMLDIRCAHIFVQPDESVMVIDPRKHYTENRPYPRKILETLKRFHAYNRFMNILKEEHPSLYNIWKHPRTA